MTDFEIFVFIAAGIRSLRDRVCHAKYYCELKIQKLQ